MDDNIIFKNITKGPAAIIKVIGVGGGGCNAVNHMFTQGIKGVEFIVCNTDAQALDISPVGNQIQLGPQLTKGRGAGAKPEVGKDATIESLEDIKKAIGNDTQMLFITAGMGGGTGTGGAPVIAKAARELNILTVGIVTTPFTYEGNLRKEYARNGIEEMRQYVDTLIVISNDKVNALYAENTLREAFSRADDVLVTAAKGIAEIITVPGLINVDFADVNTVMRESGVAIMGSAIATGEDRAQKAIVEAMSSPLLNNNKIIGAKQVLINISYGSSEVLMNEISTIINYVQKEATNSSNIIFGVCPDDRLEEAISVTLIATSFETDQNELLPEGFRSEPKAQPVNNYSYNEPPVYQQAPRPTPAPQTRPVAQPKPKPVVQSNVVRPPVRPVAPQTTIQTHQEQPVNRVVADLSQEITPTVVEQPPQVVEKVEPNNLIKPLSPFEKERKETPIEQTSFIRDEKDSFIPGTKITEDEDKEFRKRLVRRRQERLKKLYRSTSDINERENEPAYRRKKYEFEKVEDDNSKPSKITFSLDKPSKNGKGKLNKGGNPLLHDQID